MTPRSTLSAVAALLALTAPLAGCGKLGELERPGPLYGAKTGVDKTAKPAADPSQTVETVDPRDRSDDPRRATSDRAANPQ